MGANGVTVPDGTRIGRVALRVNDPDEVAAFYSDVVGLERRTEGESSPSLVTPDGGPLVELVGDSSADPRRPSETGLFHLAIRVPTRESLAAVLRRVRADWRLDGASDHGVSEALYFRDPEDNGLEVYHDRPRGEWSLREDGRVRLVTRPLDLPSLAALDDGSDSVAVGTDVGHVHLEVSDLDVARAFYVGGLGFRIADESDGVLFLAAGDYHHHLAVNTWNRRRTEPRGRGLEWFELVVPTGESIDSIADGLSNGDVDVTPRDGTIRVVDPDGIRIRFSCERDG